MSETSNPSNQKHLRDEYPSGWLMLTRNDSVPYVIDALLDAPPHREFNQSELAREAGVSRQSVARHLDLLVGTGLLIPVENTNPTRYQFNPEGPVGRAIIRLDSAMNTAGAESQPEV